MCLKNGKKLHINNCLAYQLINMETNSSLGSYLCEKKLKKTKENIQTNYISNKLYFSHIHLFRIVRIRDFCYTGN